MLVYYEPLPGMEHDGKEVTCGIKISVTEQEAVLLQRYAYRNKLHVLSDEQLLDEFCLCNWAHKED